MGLSKQMSSVSPAYVQIQWPWVLYSFESTCHPPAMGIGNNQVHFTQGEKERQTCKHLGHAVTWDIRAPGACGHLGHVGTWGMWAAGVGCSLSFFPSLPPLLLSLSTHLSQVAGGRIIDSPSFVSKVTLTLFFLKIFFKTHGRFQEPQSSQSTIP